MRSTLCLLGLSAVVATLACGPKVSASDPSKVDDASLEALSGPTAEQVARATITGVFEGEQVTLAEGRWEGEPFVEGGASLPLVWLTSSESFWLVGDVDGDAAAEAVVHLTLSTGGSGNFGYVAVMGREGDEAVQKAIGEIGDRVQVREARLDGQHIVLDVMRAGPDDGMCCPTELATLDLTVEEGQLTVATEVTGTASLDILAGQEWVLKKLPSEELAPAEPEITLVFEEGAVSGSSGCNTYRGSVAVGEIATSLEVGPLAGTRMSCRPEVLKLEQRYLTALQGASGWGFFFSQLQIDYQQGETWGRLVFDKR